VRSFFPLDYFCLAGKSFATVLGPDEKDIGCRYIDTVHRTSFPSISWVPQVISVALLGAGTLVTFWQGMNYIIDCYGFYSNSAIAINTFIRSIAGAGFPLFAPQMYHNLGVPWASSLLGFLCIAFLPVPILFYLYGAKIRQKSKFVPTG